MEIIRVGAIIVIVCSIIQVALALFGAEIKLHNYIAGWACCGMWALWFILK